MKKGFTLIELLIVVAIIGILAAIAIPNFLNAQVRAKVSRARADLKTVATSLELYRVDFNSYPTYHYSDYKISAIEFHIGGEVPGFGVPDPNWNGKNPLTSPISYMSSMPKDPFASHFKFGPVEIKEYLYVNWPYAVAKVTSPSWQPVFIYSYHNYGPYRLHSRGPDNDGPDSGIPYDPTNGITSDGDITYSPKAGFDKAFPYPTNG